ncbi:NADH dehydrogenase [ubiquinone] 1 alpha subcomplex subunit 2 [Neocloeon triangulifer]|uniref:NADH dehydrogenase [ubiquinone] 1 alpha subcomplex subunit 2 n=1 Tax=Neocloeon triangulifer TaxID=2078957 RepID=UPI00286EE2FF|nr:NADH dehydrogenase [ubiquinone] 1 alpha subcomplex subunit 2 [Neocloeon triangulifer]
MAGRALKFGSALKELRIHLCQKSEQSRGAREFVEKHYTELKKSNPRFPILIRECSGVQPRVYARYDLGKESSVSLNNLGADDIFKQIEKLAK